MILKGSAVFAILLAILQPAGPVFCQATGSSRPEGQIPPASTSTIPAPQTPVQHDTNSPAATPDCGGFPCDYTPPNIAVANPPPTPEPWPLYAQIAWAANVVLAIVGYVGIILAVSTLKKIERHTRSTEALAEAAAASAQAALMNAQAMVDSGRPWLLVSPKPSHSSENSFTVMATNRGRSPAKIISSVEQITIAIDEAHLPKTPEYKSVESGAPFVPIILVPGESTAIKSICRDDLRAICETEETFKRVEYWEAKVFLYGKVVYRDLTGTAGKQDHETAWCCWYIHGRQKSGLVSAGPPAYNVHT